jgi:hypothetical protein
VVNFGVFFILNTGIEIKIVCHMVKELKDKKEWMSKMNDAKLSTSSAVTTPSIALQADLNDKKKEDEDVKRKRKVILMVILNSIFNLLLRSPDILFWLENKNIYTFLFTFENADDYLSVRSLKVSGLLSFVADMSYFTYILTFTTNFVIFYKFNTKFNEAVVFFSTTSKKSK